MASTEAPAEPNIKVNPRFEIELEFVSALANPGYLQYLSVTYPNLFVQQESSTTTEANDENTEAACFVRYLKYLLDYWRKPEYVQYLTHPAATIRNLELLQIEQFRKDLTRPELSGRLTEGFAGVGEYVPPNAEANAPEGEDAVATSNEAGNAKNGTANVGT